MIRLRNVRVNNLNGVDLDIPHGQWVSFCGVSGSGKSSLAFDTLYAEGQRRYIENLSPHTRQFVEQFDKPDADRIEGIPPALAVRAYRGKVGKKTTVGGATEILGYLRILFSNIAKINCPDCNISVRRSDPQSVAMELGLLPTGTRYQVTFRCPEDENWAQSLLVAKRNGFVRAIVGGQTIDLSAPDLAHVDPNSISVGPIRIVVDRLKSGAVTDSRDRESIEIAFQFGQGACDILVDSPDCHAAPLLVDERNWERRTFSSELSCRSCRRDFPVPDPRLFSVSHRLGACVECDGVGWLGNQDAGPCPGCKGHRLNEDALSFLIGGKNLFEIEQLTIDEAIEFFRTLELSDSESRVTRQVVSQIESRLSYLGDVGLSYLSLGRRLRTLSIGEAQRVSLTACLGSSLVGLLYVLDEPSIGLHAHDVKNLVRSVERIHLRGNTVVVVDHEESLIRSAQRIIEIGPAAGASGGDVVFDGNCDELLDSKASLTGDYLSGRRGIAWGREKRRSPRGRIHLTGARGHNLKNINVDFPLGCICVVTGVSGAGKSSLVQQTLYGAICERKAMSCDRPLPFDELFGENQFDDVVLIDQNPIGKSSRSNPVTYVKAFDDIRRTYAETLDAKTHNVNVGKFSFNVPGGRCDKCNGEGQTTIDMQFMPDIHIDCDQCRGTRYRDEVLAVKYRGKNIAEALNLTVREAFSFFRGQPKVQAKLKSLIDVGLEYVRLGQPATTLSSGESQRLKLGHYLNSSKSKRALFILDEPTTGLHRNDVTKLLDCFESLVSVGHSMIVVDHNMHLIKNADWVVDLGPGAADEGGQVVVSGTPEDVAACEESTTGFYLRQQTGYESRLIGDSGDGA